MTARNTQIVGLALLCGVVWSVSASIGEGQTGQSLRTPTRYAKRTAAQTGVVPSIGHQAPYLPQHLRQHQSSSQHRQPVRGQVRPTTAYVTQDGIVGQPLPNPNAATAQPAPQITMQDAPIVQGDLITEQPFVQDGGYYQEGEVFGDYYPGRRFLGRRTASACNDGSCGQCEDCVWRHFGGAVDNVQLGLGIQGFKNPLNRDQDGSFGFNGSANLGLHLNRLSCGLFSGQIGFRSVQSNFSGSSFSNENRDQLFVTAGLFRRVDYGLQGGLAFDYLNENWYTQITMTQLRGELSWVGHQGNTLGFRFARGLKSDDGDSILETSGGSSSTINESWGINDQYRFFFRKAVGQSDGNLDFSVGYTEDSQNLFGVDFNIPLRSETARIYGGFTYLASQNNILASVDNQEAWNISFGLHFTPRWRQGGSRYHQPLFEVADNGSFQVNRE